MNGLQSILAASAALALASAAAQAQDRQLSEQEVQQFLNETEQSITEAVKSGDFTKIRDWTENRIADGASFTASVEFFAGDERKGFTSLTLSKEDMVKLGGISAGVLSAMQKGGIEDYSLQIEMTGFTPIGPNAALVKTEMTERGRFLFPQTAAAGMSGPQASGATQTGADSRPRAEAGGKAAEMEGTAQCSHIIQRAEGAEELQMGLTTCHAEARLDLN